jgi:hypothetical protein
MSILRSVSPIHIEYLRNMGVGASLSISILVDGKLWGLFACHHYAPKPISSAAPPPSCSARCSPCAWKAASARSRPGIRNRGPQICRPPAECLGADNARLLDDPSWLIDLADAIPADGIGVWINGALRWRLHARRQRHSTELVRC